MDYLVDGSMHFEIRPSAVQSDVMIPPLRRGLTRLQSYSMFSREEVVYLRNLIPAPSDDRSVGVPTFDLSSSPTY